MKKWLLIGLAAYLFTSNTVLVSKVYVCDSNTSVAYYSKKECRCLNKCTHKIIHITQKETINDYGKRACKI
jgi:hypothetical protein